MKTKTNETNKTNNEETFLRIFDNVKRCKNLDWIERVILSHHISFVINGKEFYQTDAYQARELGLSPAQINKYTSRLKERGLIDTRIEYEENTKGGRPIPVRYVTVIDMNKWTKGDAVPVVKGIISPSKKRLAKKMAELTNTKTEAVNTPATINSIEDSPNTPKPIKETNSLIKPNKVLKEKTLEENLAEAEAKKRTSTSTQQIKTNTLNDIITIDAYNDVVNSNNIAKIVKTMISEGHELEYITVNVRFEDNEIVTCEAVQMPSGKYVLKSFLAQVKKEMANNKVEL